MESVLILLLEWNRFDIAFLEFMKSCVLQNWYESFYPFIIVSCIFSFGHNYY